MRCAATCTAEPPTNSEREPALPKPVPRSVSPNATVIRSSGTPNTSTASCAKVVASEVPIGCVALKISMPSSPTVTVTVSVNTSAPVHSRNVLMPRPRSRPRAAEAACRAAKPLQSACASAEVEDALELARVVGLAHRIAVGHLRGPDQVAAAKLDAVDAGLAARPHP